LPIEKSWNLTERRRARCGETLKLERWLARRREREDADEEEAAEEQRPDGTHVHRRLTERANLALGLD
jgi:hypothetical protein